MNKSISISKSKLTDKLKKDMFNCLVVKDMNVKQTAKYCNISERTIYNWYNEDQDFLQFSTRVRETKAHKLAESAEKDIDMIDEVDSGEDRHVVRNEINKLKASFDMKLRLAGLYNRPLFGDKTQVDQTITVTHDISERLAKARAKALQHNEPITIDSEPNNTQEDKNISILTQRKEEDSYIEDGAGE